MTVTEANQVNVLLRWVLRGSPEAGSDKAREAAKYLSGRATKTLLAGISPDDVDEQWPHRGGGDGDG